MHLLRSTANVLMTAIFTQDTTDNSAQGHGVSSLFDLMASTTMQVLHRLEQPEAVPWTDGPALLMSGIITGAGGGAVVLVKRIPSPSIIAYSDSI